MSGVTPFFGIDPVWRSPIPYCSTKEDRFSRRQSDSLLPPLLRSRFGLDPCGFEGDNPLRLERTTPFRAHGAFTFKSLFSEGLPCVKLLFPYSYFRLPCSPHRQWVNRLRLPTLRFPT